MIQQTEFTLSAKRRGFHLGTWQGIYLCEFFASKASHSAERRDYGGERRIVATIIGE